MNIKELVEMVKKQYIFIFKYGLAISVFLGVIIGILMIFCSDVSDIKVFVQ